MHDASAQASPRKPRRRFAAGPARPRYLENRDLDKVTMMLVALMAEVSCDRDRIDTIEALVEAGRMPTAAEIENFTVTSERAARRDERRAAMMKRVFRVLLEEIEEVTVQADGSAARKDD